MQILRLFKISGPTASPSNGVGVEASAENMCGQPMFYEKLDEWSCKLEVLAHSGDFFRGVPFFMSYLLHSTFFKHNFCVKPYVVLCTQRTPKEPK